MLKKITRLAVILGGFAVLPGCASGLAGPEYRIWQEEVKLSDGRIIVVTQKKRCEGAYTGGNYANCIAREAWLTINLPEFSTQEIVWHANLNPRVVDIHAGRLYVVGWPPTGREFRLYNKPRPPYIGFMFENGQWIRIPLEAIPEAIYDTNMLIESIPSSGTTFLTLVNKESREVNGNPTYKKHQKRIDPSYKSNFN
jgi:hypothetical protein